MGHGPEHQGGEGLIRVLAAAGSCALFRSFGKPQAMPINLTVSVSYACNSRCRTCNIWKKRAQDLTLDEYEKTFRGIGRSAYWVTLSGGEPFLRSDLDKIALSLYRNCGPIIINIPTNGLLGERIAEISERISESCPSSQVVVNLSLDGIGEKHDAIRGVPGNFERAMKAYAALREIKHRNFSLGIHTVISRFNAREIPKICDFVLDELKPDSYISEVAEQRAELGTIGADITPCADEYARAVDYISARMKSVGAKGVSRLTKAFRSGYYESAKSVLHSNKQAIPCCAGTASAQISPDGDVWGCCVRAVPLGNLRQSGYDFRRIWFSEKAQSFRDSVKSGSCACPLANAYYSSALCSPYCALKTLAALILAR